MIHWEDGHVHANVRSSFSYCVLVDRHRRLCPVADAADASRAPAIGPQCERGTVAWPVSSERFAQRIAYFVWPMGLGRIPQHDGSEAVCARCWAYLYGSVSGRLHSGSAEWILPDSNLWQ